MSQACRLDATQIATVCILSGLLRLRIFVSRSCRRRLCRAAAQQPAVLTGGDAKALVSEQVGALMSAANDTGFTFHYLPGRNSLELTKDGKLRILG